MELSEDDIAGIRLRAQLLYHRKDLIKYHVSKEEAESIALSIAVHYAALYDPSKGRTFRNYLLHNLDLELPRCCAREGAVMQRFFSPSVTRREAGSGRRTEWSFVGYSLSGGKADCPVSHQSFAVEEANDDGFEELVEWCLSQLTTRRWQRIFYLRVVEALEFGQIGQRVGITRQAVEFCWRTKILPILRRAAKCWY